MKYIPKQHRVVLHFETQDLDGLVYFYTEILPFDLIEKITLAGGEEVAVVAKRDNHHIQLSFHKFQSQRNIYNEKLEMEFSIQNVDELRRILKLNNIKSEAHDHPWVSGNIVKDPIGNKLIFSEHYSDQ